MSLIKHIYRDSGKIFFVGDLHGCYTKFMEQLLQAGFNMETDLCICTGDLIDRGTENVKCLELLDEPWFESVKGNHEDLAVKGVIQSSEHDSLLWMYNGGNWYLDYMGTDDQQYVHDLIARADKLPLALKIATPSHKFLVCHADYQEFKNGHLDQHLILWNRDRYKANVNGCRTQIEDYDMCFFGHTPIDNVTTYGNITYLDTGLVFTGDLGIHIVDLNKR